MGRCNRVVSEQDLDDEILRYVAEREITRLVHFTRADALCLIMACGAVLSRELLDRGTRQVPKLGGPANPISRLYNDSSRFDGHRDYICLSVEYPNVHLLDSYKEEHADATWVVLFLHPHLLALPNTKFSPVNAATENGHYISEGIDGFQRMFDDPVRGGLGMSRGESHLDSCPTDMQAEVLVQRVIPSRVHHESSGGIARSQKRSRTAGGEPPGLRRTETLRSEGRLPPHPMGAEIERPWLIDPCSFPTRREGW